MSKKKSSFYKNIFALVLPMAAQNLINVGVMSADVIMLGKFNDKVLAAASLAGQIPFILTLTLFGISSGSTVLTAQYWGKGDKKAIERILGIALRIALIIAAIFFIFSFFFPGLIMDIFSNDEFVKIEGIKYLKIVSFSFILSTITMVYLNILRSMERVTISTMVYGISLIVNIIINALLIFGLFGLPRLGIVGASIGTLIARTLELLIVYFYSKKKNTVLSLSFKNMFNVDKLLQKDFFKYASPIIVNELVWAGGISVGVAILGNLSSAAVAANSIVQIIRQLFMVITFGFATSSSIIIGKLIGENNFSLATNYAYKFVKLTTFASVTSSLILFVSRPFIVAQFALTDEIQDLLYFMLTLMCVYIIFQAYNALFIVGIFRAGGDSKIGLIIDAATSWTGSLLLGFLAGFVFKLPIKIVYMLLISDELFKFPIVIWRFKTKKWLKNVTRDFD